MFERIKGFLGFNDAMDDEIDDIEEAVVEEKEQHHHYHVQTANALAQQQSQPVKKQPKVVNIHSTSQAKLTITKPLKYDDATEICTALKNRKIVVVNTTALELKVAQRLIDFISGACYALEGDFQEVEKGVFIVTPSNIDVSNEFKNELTNKGLFNWSR